MHRAAAYLLKLPEAFSESSPVTQSASTKSTPYPAIDPSPDVPRMEADVLEFWKREGIFQASIDQRPAEVDGETNQFVFYDGPPFANGLPHYGHMATGYVKDLVPRFRTMQGRRVERRFGWDCHGLPAEMAAEKELGISGRLAILDYGMDKFNDYCRESVLRYTNDWQYYVERMGRWVDFENDYKTMDPTFMESVLWAFKTLYDKGLVYRGSRVVPYSWAMQTPLSNFETRLDNSYRERQDPALTVLFRLKEPLKDGKPASVAAWTTTPWTLPSNLACAVGPEFDYAIMEKDGEHVVLADALREAYAKELEGYEKAGSLKGSELAGREYEPLFPFFADTENAFRVLAADFVTLESGTGIVHTAPAFGEDDLAFGRANGIPLVAPVDDQGNFTKEVPPYHGMNIFDANKEIIKDLKDAGKVLRHETYLHNYPHCWRTDTPLIYKAIDAWYVEVTAIKDRMVELNQTIDWIPGHVKDGLFGNWLENARDWNISRNRFWGCPIPIWMSDDPDYPRIDVYGSLDEIAADFGRRPDDLHRPHIDEFVRPNPDDPSGKAMMRRVPEVLDVWFDSGSMPFAQLHYPFENKEKFEKNFPADFIVEYMAQTRGWFYTLMVLSTALFDKAPFQNCICHGVVLGDDKQKLSKRLKNYPDPNKVLAEHGSDALRVYMLSSSLLAGGDLIIHSDARGIQEALRKTILPLWNASYFFTLYANADGYKAQLRTDSRNEHDRYILAKTREFVETLTERLEANDIPGAYGLVSPFLDVSNNWHIRRNRARFWGAEVTDDKRDAFDTLYTVLVTLVKALAPLMPFVTEAIYRNLTGETSVHLADWPDVSAFPQEAELIRDMDLARDICGAGLSIRVRQQQRLRQPLKKLTIAHPEVDRLRPFEGTIADELNVKAVGFDTDPAAVGELVLKVDPRRLGKQLGPKMKDVIAASKSGDWSRREDGTVEIAGVEIGEDDYDLLVTTGGSDEDAQMFDAGRGTVLLDLELTDELRSEAKARDFVRLVQDARKEADFDVSDRITIRAGGSDAVLAALREHEAYIRGETLAEKLELGVEAGSAHQIDGEPVTVEVTRV